MTAAGLAEVRLLALPVQLWAATQEHMDGLLREFALLKASEEHDRGIPGRLVDLVDALQARYSSGSEEQRAALHEAAAAGETRMDLTYRLPPAAGPAVEELDRMLDDADEYCRRGTHLLTMPPPREQVAFRKWYLGEFRSQLAGASPTPWSDGEQRDR